MSMKVSIICNTYNHELYNKQCLEGFINQITNFQFEILIHDDASTDKTQEIIELYHQKYPKLIYPILQKINQCQQGKNNWIEYQFQRAKGKYIALCDGDDYWSDPHKLQKQVNFLEAHEDYVCVGGKVRIKDTRNEINKLQYGQQYFEYSGSQRVPKEDILDKVKLPFHTSTFLFRRSAVDLDLFKLLFEHSISGDIPILNMLNAKGKIFYIDEEFGVQHHNNGGITNTEGHTGLNYLWNRIYMWEQISKLYNQKNVRMLASDNKKYFKEIFKKKFLNVRLANQLRLFRNIEMLHWELARIMFVILIQKALLKLKR